MNIKTISLVFAVILLLVIIGGVGYKIVAPTNKTILGPGSKVVNLNTEKPSIPLGGCSVFRVNMKAYWEKSFKIEEKR